MVSTLAGASHVSATMRLVYGAGAKVKMKMQVVSSKQPDSLSALPLLPQVGGCRNSGGRLPSGLQVAV